jgi:signal transduction histidine kinase
MSTETTRKVLARLELLEEPYQKKIVRNPKIRLTELADTWRGLTRIKMDLPTELNSFSPNGEVIAQLIEESVINAIRHGKAKNVRVNVTIENEICYIQIQDDGKLKSTRKPGLGSTFFQVFAPDWKLETNEVGTLATMSTPF